MKITNYKFRIISPRQSVYYCLKRQVLIKIKLLSGRDAVNVFNSLTGKGFHQASVIGNAFPEFLVVKKVFCELFQYAVEIYFGKILDSEKEVKTSPQFFRQVDNGCRICFQHTANKVLIFKKTRPNKADR